MPITQERVQALLLAAKDYKQALQFAERSVKLALAASFTPEAAFLEIQRLGAIITESGLLKQPIETTRTLVAEEQHQRTHGPRNTRRRDKLRGGALGHTAPKAIHRDAQVPGSSSGEDISQMDSATLAQANFKGLSAETIAQINREADVEVRAQEYLDKQQAMAKGPKGLYDTDDEPEVPEPIVADENNG